MQALQAPYLLFREPWWRWRLRGHHELNKQRREVRAGSEESWNGFHTFNALYEPDRTRALIVGYHTCS